MSAIRPISDLQFGVANTEIGVIQAPEPGPRIMRYELTDFEWTAIRPFLPNKPRGVPRVNDRRVLNGIFWISAAVRARHYRRNDADHADPVGAVCVHSGQSAEIELAAPRGVGPGQLRLRGGPDLRYRLCRGRPVHRRADLGTPLTAS